MRMLRELDPAATEARRSKQLKRRRCKSDGYDKLKPYRLSIHGAVDSFSGKILRLEVCKSNNHSINPACFFCWSDQGIRILSKLTQNWHRYWKWPQWQIYNVRWEKTRQHKNVDLQLQLRGLSYIGRLIDFVKVKITEGRFFTNSHLPK